MKGFQAFAVATLILVKPGACFIQPGIVSTPNLPIDVSSPDKWIHTTPLLKTVDTLIPEANSPTRRRAASPRPRSFWHGWENVNYLFCLYVFRCLEAGCLLTVHLVAIRTRAQASTLAENSLTLATRLAIQYILALPLQTVQIMSIF